MKYQRLFQFWMLVARAWFWLFMQTVGAYQGRDKNRLRILLMIQALNVAKELDRIDMLLALLSDEDKFVVQHVQEDKQKAVFDALDLLRAELLGTRSYMEAFETASAFWQSEPPEDDEEDDDDDGGDLEERIPVPTFDIQRN